MGITLTGKRVQNTYDSLLKLSSNDNLTATPQLVGDGLGNDSPIYLSETKVGIGVSPSFQFQTSDAAKIGGNLTVGGNLIVEGTTTQVDSTIVEIGDNMIELAKDNISNIKDIGWYGTIVESGTKYVGFYYDASSGITTPTFYLGYGTTEPSNTASWTTKGKLVIGQIDSTGGTFSGQITIPQTPTADGHAASKKYVDDQIGGADKARRVTITVKNTETVALSAGTVVHAHPTAPVPSGNLVQIKKADYDTASLMPAIGILNEDLDAAGGTNDEGEAIMFGFINGIDTSGFSAGDELYVGNDGALTNSKPLLTTQLIQKIAVVMKVDSTNGSIEVFGAGRSNDVPNEVDRDLSIAGNLKVDDYIEVEADSGFGYLEIGGPAGGYIDLKTPFSDDYDLRFITGTNSISEITASSTLRLNAGNTLTLTLDGSTQAATFAGDITVSGGDIILGGTGRIQGIDTITDGTDAVNKDYVDDLIALETLDTVTSRGSTTSNSILTGNIEIQNSARPTLTLDDNGNAGGGGAEGVILFKNNDGNAIGLGYTADVTSTSDFIISTDAGSTYGGYLDLNVAAIDDPSDIILDPKSKVLVTKNATFTGQLNVEQDLFVNPDYNNSSEFLYLRKHQSADGGILFQSKTSGDVTQSDWQIRNQGTTGDLKFYAYGLSGEALILDRENGNATFAGTIQSDDITIVDGTNDVNLYFANTSYGIQLDYSAGDMFFRTNGATRLTIANGGSATFDGDILPNTDSSYDIGTNTVRFANVYADNFHGLAKDLEVTSNDTFNGTYSLLWHSGADVYSSTFMTINGSTDTFSVPNILTTGDITIGADSGGERKLIIHGGASGSLEGGDIELHLAADYDSTYAYYRIDAYADDFRIGREGTTDILLDSNGDTRFYGTVGINMAPPSAYQFATSYTQTDPNADFRFAHFIDANFSGADNTTADREQGGIFMDIDSSADGDASHEHRLYGIYIDQRFSGFSDVSTGIYSRVESNNNTEKTANIHAIHGYAVHDTNSAGGVSSLNGVKGETAIEDNGDIDNAYGIFGRTLVVSTRASNVDATYGGYFEVQTDSPNAITYGSMHAVRATIDNNEGAVPTFGNQYLYYGDYQGTKGSNAYGFYFTLEDKNYLSSKLGIANENPQALLQLGAATPIGADALIARGNTAGTYAVSIEQDHVEGWGMIIDTDSTVSGDPALKITNPSGTLFEVASNGDTLINGDVTINGIDNATAADADRVLVTSDTSGEIQYRTTAQLADDMNVPTGIGSAGKIPIYETTNTFTTGSLNWDIANGRMGINEISPDERLHVGGNAKIDGDVNISNSSGATLNINTNLGAADSKILLHEGSTSSPANGASIRYDGVNNLFKIGVGTNVDTTRLTIARDTGNVGIGVSPYSFAQLHIYDTSDIYIAIQKGTANGYIINDGTNISLASDQGSTGKKLLVNRNAPDNSLIIDSSGDATFAGDVSLVDNKKIKLGTGSDLQLYHDGANSYIETSTSSAGDLYIKAQGTNHDLYLQAVDDIFIRPQGGENGIHVAGNGGVLAYHNNVLKLATASAGVNMYGQVLIDAQGTGNNLHVWDDSTSAQNGLICTNTGNQATSTLTLYAKNYGSAVSATVFGQNIGSKSIVAQADGGGGLLLGCINNAPIYIGTNNALRMKVDNAGTDFYTDGVYGVQIHGSGTIEGGHLTLKKASSYTYQWALDNYADRLRFIRQNDDGTGGVVYARFESDGDLQIARYLEHYGDTNTYLGFPAADDFIIVVGGRELVRLDEGTDPDIAKFMTDEFRMYSSGDFHADGDVIAYSTTTSSDKRLKKDIKPIDNALDIVNKLQGVHFNWKENDEKSIGYIAQDVEKILPEMVKEKNHFDKGEFKTVNYAAMVSIMGEAIKELSAKVEALENKKCNCNCK